MHKKDLLLCTPLLSKSRDVFTHEFEVRLAECDSVHRTGNDIEDSAETLRTGENPSDSAERRQGRIVRVKRHLHTRLLGFRNYCFQEIFKITPDFFFAHF